MGQQKGANAKVLLGFQDDLATIATAGTVMSFNSSGLNASRNLTSPGTMRGHRQPAEPIAGNWDVAGALGLPLDTRELWYWLKLMFGNPATVANSTNWIHKFKVGATQPAATIEHQFLDLDTDIFNQYLGCMANGFSFSIGDDGELVFNLDIIGTKEIQALSSFDAAPTVPNFARLNTFQAAIQENGSTLAISTDFSLKVEFGLDPKRFIGGQGYVGQINEGQVKVNGNVKTIFQDAVMLNKAINNTTTSLVLTIGTLDSAKVVFTIPELKFSPKSAAIDGGQGLMIDLPFEAFYSNAAANSDESVIVTELYNGDEHA